MAFFFLFAFIQFLIKNCDGCVCSHVYRFTLESLSALNLWQSKRKKDWTLLWTEGKCIEVGKGFLLPLMWFKQVEILFLFFHFETTFFLCSPPFDVDFACHMQTKRKQLNLLFDGVDFFFVRCSTDELNKFMVSQWQDSGALDFACYFFLRFFFFGNKYANRRNLLLRTRNTNNTFNLRIKY